jgi:hypothetical protein
MAVAVVGTVIDEWPMSVCRTFGLKAPRSAIAAIIRLAKSA